MPAAVVRSSALGGTQPHHCAALLARVRRIRPALPHQNVTDLAVYPTRVGGHLLPPIDQPRAITELGSVVSQPVSKSGIPCGVELLTVEANDKTTFRIFDILEQHPITNVMGCLTGPGRQPVCLLDIGCVPKL